MKRSVLPLSSVGSSLVGLLLLSGCGAGQGHEVTASVSDAPADVPTATVSAVAASRGAGQPMPCDPGSGFPVHRDGCPDRQPTTGWLTVSDAGLTLTPFRTLRNDAEGAAYAREHGEEYPFPNDYFDAAAGVREQLETPTGTVCTGIILVGYREPLTDHVVACDQLSAVAARRPVPVAVWQSGGEVVQVSELYRP